MTSPPAAAELEVDDNTSTMAACFHTCTWFHVQGSDKVARTWRGTRPGDGWADLLFNFVVCRLLQDIRQELEDLGMCFSVLWNGECGLRASPGDASSATAFATAWADDLAFMLWGETPGSIIEALQMLTSEVITRFQKRGLQFNFEAGKTEIVLHLRGRNSTRLRRSLFSTNQPHLEVQTDDSTTAIRLVREYVHLGGILHGKGSMRPELRHRLAVANDAFQQHRHAVYQQTQLSLIYRTRIFEACVMSTAFYGAGTWANDPQRPQVFQCRSDASI